MGALHPQLIEKDTRTGALSVAEYIPDIGNYSEPKPAIFWPDFLGSVLLTDGFIYLSVRAASFSTQEVLCTAMAVAFLFRASAFLHEAVHAGKRIRHFQTAYNLLIGFVFKLPLYTYDPHKYHHTIATYGTKNDPEYDLLKATPAYFIIPVFTQMLMPLLLLVRFGFFPLLLPFIGEKGRNAVYKYASTFALNLRFQRSLPDAQARREWYRQDAACVLYNSVFFYLMATAIWPWKVFFVWYCVMYLAFLVNFYRAMISHTYSTNLETTNRKQQILDSVTFAGSWAMEWFYPVGLRYHALHHLMPHVPYHGLHKLHRAIIAAVPADHPYRVTIARSYLQAAKKLAR